MSLLVICLPLAHYTNQALDFMLLAGGELVDAGRAPARGLPSIRDRDHEVVALVPLRALSWHQVQLPPGVNAQSPRLRAVLEGLLEDQLLDQPGDMHLALAGSGHRDGGADRAWVAACERRWLAMAVQGLEAAGCRLSRALPEWGPPQQARLHVTGPADAPEMVLCNAGGLGLLPLNRETLAWALPGDLPADALSAEPELVDSAQALLQRPVRPWPRSERWAGAAAARWDLARGLLMRRRAQRSPLEWLRAPRWRAARWATLGLVGVNLLGFNALAWSHSVQLQSRREQMRQALLQTFPQVPAEAVTDPPLQMRRELERLRAASAQPTPADLPVMLGAVLPALPEGRSPQALDYAEGQLRLQGLNLSAAQLQALSGQLERRGYSARAQGADLLVRVRP